MSDYLLSLGLTLGGALLVLGAYAVWLIYEGGK